MRTTFTQSSLLVLEHLVRLRRFVQREPVGDHEGWVDLAALDPLQQRCDVALHVALTAPEGDRAVHPGPDGELVHQPAVDADDGDGAAVAAGQDGLAQRGPVGFGPYRLLDAVVGLQRCAVGVRLHADGVDAGSRGRGRR